MLNSTTNRSKISKYIPQDEPIDFTFDDQKEKNVILNAWDRYMASRSDESRKRYGTTPRFEDDQKFLPLQAADFWAWWVREWSEQGVLRDKLQSLDFGAWKGHTKNRGAMIIDISFTEQQLFEMIRDATREILPPGKVIYDVTFSAFPTFPAKS